MIDGPTRKQPDSKVTLLGTGGPELTRDRMGAATLIKDVGKLGQHVCGDVPSF